MDFFLVKNGLVCTDVENLDFVERVEEIRCDYQEFQAGKNIKIKRKNVKLIYLANFHTGCYLKLDKFRKLFECEGGDDDGRFYQNGWFSRGYRRRKFRYIYCLY